MNVLYTSPVADIIKRHNLMYHLSADDTQLYVSLKLGSDDHVTPSLIMDLHWLRVDHRIIYKIFFLLYKVINGLNSYISNLLSFCSSSYSLRSCSNKLLQVPRSKLKS